MNIEKMDKSPVEQKEIVTKPINAYLEHFVKLHSTNEVVEDVVKEITKCIEGYDYNLTWNQIDLLEQALGDLVVSVHRRTPTHRLDLMSIAAFIIACGTANAAEKQ